MQRFLREQGLRVGAEFCVYPSRGSRRRTVADLVGVVPDEPALSQRMRLERRRVTVAEFWPALLQTLTLAPDEPFRRGELLPRLEAHPLTRGMPAARLSRYLRTLRRYGYLRRTGRVWYRRRSAYVPVARGERTAAVELKRDDFGAAVAQATSYARVIPTVWIAAGARFPDAAEAPELHARLRRHGLGALEVHARGGRVCERLAPQPGRALDPRLSAYRLVLEERVVREQRLARPRAFA